MPSKKLNRLGTVTDASTPYLNHRYPHYQSMMKIFYESNIISECVLNYFTSNNKKNDSNDIFLVFDIIVLNLLLVVLLSPFKKKSLFSCDNN